MASPYKLPMLGAFLLATGFSIWTGTQLATRRSPNTSLRSLNLPPDATASSKAAPRASSPTQGSTGNLLSNVPVGIELEECIVTMAQVNDPRPPLSIRDTPSPQGNIVGEANQDQIIDVAGSQGEWFAVTDPVQGWAPRSLTQYACNEKTARVSLTRGRQSVEIAGRFVGTGNHQYKLKASKNQTLTLINLAGPMPVLTAPDNQVIFSGPEEGDPADWSGTLPTDGEYLLRLDSNFRGYDYRFNLKLD